MLGELLVNLITHFFHLLLVFLALLDILLKSQASLGPLLFQVEASDFHEYLQFLHVCLREMNVYDLLSAEQVVLQVGPKVLLEVLQGVVVLLGGQLLYRHSEVLCGKRLQVVVSVFFFLETGQDLKSNHEREHD